MELCLRFMKRRIRVLISSPSLDASKNVSGISAVVAALIESNKEVQYYHLELGRTDKDKLGIVSYLNSIWKLISFPFVVICKKVDVYHQNLPFNNKGLLREFLFNLLARLCIIPVVLHIHGGEFLMKKPNSKLKLMLINSIFHGCKVRIVLSDVEMESLKILYGYDSISLPNSVNTEFYSCKELKTFNSIPKVIFLGRFHESKGLLVMIKAFRELYKKYRFKFLLFGKGDLESFIVKELKAFMGEDFYFGGVVSGEEKVNALTESDYFILPSIYGEGLPIALLEAMSCGLIPIVTDDASMKVVVQHMKNGIRIEKGSSLDIEEKLETLFKLPIDKKKRMSFNAVRTVKENYSSEKFLTKLDSIYKHSLS